ncbi:MAG: pilus assembly protein TadG-related protein [Negativicutes bacterium]|nr:pilus assembly protein TadG-related protein [Negativicutes bacterium]
MNERLSNTRGGVMLLFAILLPCLLIVTGLVIDIGYHFVEKAKLQNMVDAAALAGAHFLPLSPQQAIRAGRDYAVRNGLRGSDKITMLLDDGHTVLQVAVTRTVPAFFAQVLGLDRFEIRAEARAKGNLQTGLPNPVALLVPSLESRR